MRSMTGIRDKGLIKPNKEMDGSRVGVFTAIRQITFLLNLPKWSKILSQKQLNGFKCRALLDTGAGSSYVSSAITDHLGLRPI